MASNAVASACSGVLRARLSVKIACSNGSSAAITAAVRSTGPVIVIVPDRRRHRVTQRPFGVDVLGGGLLLRPGRRRRDHPVALGPQPLDPRIRRELDQPARGLDHRRRPRS